MEQQCYPGIYQYTLDNSDDAGVNSIQIYVISGESGQRSLMIDAGFGHPECLEKTEAVLKELGIAFEDLDIFITHEHNDHSGLAFALEKMGARILMNPDEERHHYEHLYHRIGYDAMEEKVQVLRITGVTQDLTPVLWECYENETNAEQTFMKDFSSDTDKEVHGLIRGFSFTPVYPGQVFHYGAFQLHVIALKGHSRGQLGLYDEEHQIIFLADQILNRIAPIVSTSRPDEHLLEAYMRSLTEIKARFSGWTAFPAHGGKIEEIGGQVERIAESYLDKLDIVKEVVAEAKTPMTTYEAAAAAYGIRKNPRSTREFFRIRSMISKTFSILEYLYEQGTVDRMEREGILYWSAKQEQEIRKNQ